MRKLLAITAMLLAIAGCDDNGSNKNTNHIDSTPSYVTDATYDIRTAILANIIKNPDFKCENLKINGYWTIGCFMHEKNPTPFLLFTVIDNTGGKDFSYKLNAINGKAKQYAENPALKMFNIDTEMGADLDIGETINQYVEKFVSK